MHAGPFTATLQAAYASIQLLASLGEPKPLVSGMPRWPYRGLRNSLGAPGYPATREALKAALLAAGGLLALLQLTPENHRVRLALSHNATRLLIACG